MQDKRARRVRDSAILEQLVIIIDVAPLARDRYTLRMAENEMIIRVNGEWGMKNQRLLLWYRASVFGRNVSRPRLHSQPNRDARCSNRSSPQFFPDKTKEKLVSRFY